MSSDNEDQDSHQPEMHIQKDAGEQGGKYDELYMKTKGQLATNLPVLYRNIVYKMGRFNQYTYETYQLPLLLRVVIRGLTTAKIMKSDWMNTTFENALVYQEHPIHKQLPNFGYSYALNPVLYILSYYVGFSKNGDRHTMRDVKARINYVEEMWNKTKNEDAQDRFFHNLFVNNKFDVLGLIRYYRRWTDLLSA